MNTVIYFTRHSEPFKPKKLMKWCNLTIEEGVLIFRFKNDIFFKGNWSTPELFKLVLDGANDLVSIENIKVNY